jgi:HemK-related putative methylase
MVDDSVDVHPADISPTTPNSPKRILEAILHFLAYHFILKSQSTRTARVAGFELTVGPTVFDPRYFLTSEFFAEFILSLELSGKRVADVGTGSGILALAAAKAGAAKVVATDINPNAVATTVENARANSLDDRVQAVSGDLLAPIPQDTRFDVILTNPPFFEGHARDVADRAWYAGPNFRDISSLFQQVRERLAPAGRGYVVLSSNCDMWAFANLVQRAGLRSARVRERSFFIESIIIYELVPSETSPSGDNGAWHADDARA